ncbi:SDR family NAD(P)-dependent oxidoreductase [Mesorhizobium loti]|uniref:SDR family NAD(P)-dependent oxidoreductase n=1 Tax=Rhizobium loti TaxID=381 RepID=UPI00041F1097|nr:SDR family NAD(P)-dependent oxidoreductase [Mesorhizobium loti]
MDLDLEGKIALVSGGSKGIGLACAKLLAAEGARIVICSRSQSNIDAAVSELPGAVGIAVDLRSGDDAKEAVEKVLRDVGPIDILVNSAGAAKRTPVQELSPQAWRAAMDDKYFPYINVIDPVVKKMAERGSGVIVNIIGNGGKVASPVHLAGGAANAALMLATVGLANAYAGRGVRIVGLNPGLTQTSRVSEGMKAVAASQGISEQEALRQATDAIPIGRLADPVEIASVVTFLCSANASYVTGVVINMDGASVQIVV